MTILDLFLASSLFTPPAAAFQAARQAHASLHVYAGSCALGLLVGVLSTWLMWYSMKLLAGSIEKLQGVLVWCVPILVLSGYIVWLVGEIGLTVRLTGELVHRLA